MSTTTMTETETETEMEEVGMIKLLASCDSKTRSASLRFLLDSWLPSQSQVPDRVMKKLWKGLFYCVWHADKLAAQTQLVNRLSSLLTQLHLPVSIQYFKVFLITIRREWPGIDVLRLDKFYLLIRSFVRCFFHLLKNNSWDLELSKSMIGVLVETTFMAASDTFPGGSGNGVNYHIVSVFMEELRPFLPVSRQRLELLLEPFVSIMGRVADRVLLAKIKTYLFDELLTMGNKMLEHAKSNSEIHDDALVALGPIALNLGFSAKFYTMGSSLECCQGNRKVLFRLHEEFLKLEKAFASSNVHIPLAHEDDEVPILVPITNRMDVDVATAISRENKVEKMKKVEKKKKERKSKKSKKKDKKSKNAVNSGYRSENVCDDGDVTVPHAETSIEEMSHDDVNFIKFNDSAISNLQMQFEKVAAEVGLDIGVSSACDSLEFKVNGATVPKKRKRAKSKDERLELAVEGDTEAATSAKSTGKIAKKVRFSIKNNLVWKPHSPLPPQSLRLPPSVTPRGSALKKGIPPGPIKEIPAGSKRTKQQAKSVKRGLKGINAICPAIKRFKKLKSLSA